MPESGSIGGSMNTIGLTSTGYTNLGAVTRTSLESASPLAAVRTTDATKRSGTTDRVELSDHARFMERLRSMPAIRAQKVADIKAQIEAGTYETDEKLSTAFDRLLDELNTTND